MFTVLLRQISKCSAICATQSVRRQTHDLPSATELDPKPVSSCVWVQLHWWHVKLKIKSTSGKPNDGTFCLLMKVYMLWLLVSLMLWTLVINCRDLGSWIDLTEHSPDSSWEMELFPHFSFSFVYFLSLFLPFSCFHCFLQIYQRDFSLRLFKFLFSDYYFVYSIPFHYLLSWFSQILLFHSFLYSSLLTPFIFVNSFLDFLRNSTFIPFIFLRHSWASETNRNDVMTHCNNTSGNI